MTDVRKHIGRDPNALGSIGATSPVALWKVALYAAMGVIWLLVGGLRLHNGEVDFTSVASTFTGLCWFVTAFLWRPRYMR